MPSIAGFIAFAAALTAAVPALASDLPNLKTLSDDRLIKLFEKVSSSEQPDACGEIIPVLAELTSRPSIDVDFEGTRKIAEFNCALDESRWSAAFKLLPEAEAILEGSFGSLGFLVALFSDNYDNAAQRLIALADAEDGEELLSLDDQRISQLLVELLNAKQFETRTRVALALLESPHAAKLSSDLRSGLAGAIITEEGRTGKFERSIVMLDKIESPYWVIGFLAMREFAPIWPQIEQKAGPNLSKTIERQLASDRVRFDKDPKNREAFQQVAHALHFAGRFEEVIAFVGTLDHSPAGIAKIGEDEAWALNVEAYALDALGRRSEAEAIFDAIAAIPYDPEENGWLVNFTINRGSRLMELGQWEKGLEAAMLAGKVSEKSGSPYAKMLVRRDTICALTQLGRKQEAALLVEEAFALRADSHSIAAAALVCAGDIDRAAQTVIEALSDPVHAETMATELQKPEFQLFYTKSELPTIRQALLPREDVRSAYDKVARDIPDAFIPLAGKRRQELIAAQP